MFLSMIEFWNSIAEGIAYGWAWLGENGGEILKYVMYLVTSGGVGTIVIYMIKVLVPIFKNSNKPVLTQLATTLEQIQALAEKQEIANQEIQVLRDENKTLKEYLTLASQVNERNITLTQDMRDKFSYLAEGLKATENAVAVEIANDLEVAIDDDTLTQQEIVEIAENVPEIENVLGMSLNDIELELKGE